MTNILKYIESARDFTSDMLAAGRVAVAALVERVDTYFADSINSDIDE